MDGIYNNEEDLRKELNKLEREELIDILLKQLDQLNELRGYHCGIRRIHLEKRWTKEDLIDTIIVEYFENGFKF